MSGAEYGRNFRAPRVDVHQFAMVPRSEIPRSSFVMQSQHKTTISASYLYPIYLQEVLPGDSFNVDMTAMCRLATPVVPWMDQIDIESWFFFVPNRLVWTHWYKFMGEQDNPGDSTSFSIPQVVSAANGFPQLSIFDYFGLPTAGQTGVGNTISVSALPLRAYNLIYSQWFRDQNLTNSLGVGSAGSLGYCAMDDGPDPVANYALVPVAKRHDYFTSCLPFTQKGSAVTLPLGTSAPVKGVGWTHTGSVAAGGPTTGVFESGGVSRTYTSSATLGALGGVSPMYFELTTNNLNTGVPTLYADLSVATAATINQIRLAFQTQKLLERDARGGTRYTEIIRSHFGVVSPDMRLMRPEYLGGGKSPITITPVPQTTATGLTGGTTPMGTLAAVGTAVTKHGFRYSATEHGHILGLVAVRRNQIYQQGIRKLWSRKTRFDYYFPVFAMLGEQAVLNSEIYSDGSANDALTFGFNERWAEYRYHPSFTSAYFRSTTTTPIDYWHTAEKFGALPALNNAFILDETNIVLRRNLAGGVQADNQQVLCDFFFNQRVARPMPMYSVPGMIDHF